MSEAGWPQLPKEGAVAPLPAVPSAPAVARRRLSRRELVLGLVVLLLLAGFGVALFVAVTNKSRADRWQARASQLQRNADALNEVVVQRTDLLNLRVRQLNAMATKVKLSQASLTQSEGDVQSLEQRQRELANEKAQLEDERVALVDVANNYITCKGDLENAIQAVANQDWGWIDANGSQVSSDCGNADSSLQSFLSAYPNG